MIAGNEQLDKLLRESARFVGNKKLVTVVMKSQPKTLATRQAL